MANSQVDWYGDDMMAIVEDASDEMLTKLAFQAEAEAKTHSRIPVDTGFMRNAIYGLGPGQSHRGAAVAAAKSKADRKLAGSPSLPPHTAALHAAALYTIYQELKHGFIMDAIQKVARLAGGIITEVGRSRL